MLTAGATVQPHPAPARPASVEPLLDRHEVARLLRVSPITITRWVRLGTFPKPLRFNNQSRFWEESAVKGFIDARRREVGR